MRIAFVSSEVHPFSKTGGLADVSGALPAALARMGHEVVVITPLYQTVDRKSHGLRMLAGRGEIPGLGGTEIWEARLPSGVGWNERGGARVLFIATAAFERPGLYQEGGKDYPDNDVRFSFFSRACLTLLKHLSFRPDAFHLNDWQTALLPVYLKTMPADGGFFSGSATIFSIHNLAYQGVFPADRWRTLDLPDRFFRISGLEFYGKINFLKGGIIFSDVLSTVSPGYAREICARSGGAGLEGVLRSRKEHLFGILNGIDYDVWNPALGNGIPAYSLERPEGKAAAKAVLQEKSGLPASADTPLFGCVTRLDPQKGCDILLQSLFRLLPKTRMQVAILGTGAHDLEMAFGNLARRFPGKVSLNLKFDNDRARLIYAGSDFFLMPSKYEPCGLGQMIAMAYGTIPVVRLTGGLANSVRPYPSSGNAATGIGFSEYSAEALIHAVSRAIALRRDTNNYLFVRKNAMLTRFTWAGAADAYVDLYARAAQIQRKGGDERMAVALQEKQAATSLVYEVGANAGKVYQYLTKKQDGDTPAQIAKSSGLEPVHCAMAIGWLARENNVVIEKVGRKVQVRLIKR